MSIPTEYKEQGISLESFFDDEDKTKILSAVIPLAQALGNSDEGKKLSKIFFGEKTMQQVLSNDALLHAASVEPSWWTRRELHRLRDPKLTFQRIFALLQHHGPTAFMITYMAV